MWRLLAGKFGEICTAFPLTIFLRKNLKRLPIRSFWSQKRLKGRKLTENPLKSTATPHMGKDWYFEVVLPSRNKFLQNSLWISFSTNLAMEFFFFARSYKSSSRYEMTNGSNRRQNVIRNGFSKLALKWPWNTVSTNWI